MSEDRHAQQYRTFNQKETDELVEIWQTNNRYEWADLTFDVIREILQERLGELPPAEHTGFRNGQVRPGGGAYPNQHEPGRGLFFIRWAYWP